MKKNLKKTARLIYRQFSWRQRVLPSLIIIGAQKSGTTSLHFYLQQHPQLVSAYQKEVHYFDSGLEAGRDTFKKGLSWYQSHFPRREDLADNQLTFEASPLYLFHPLVPERISKQLPNVKMVALLRDPVERAISQFFYETRVGYETLPIMEAFRSEQDRLQSSLENQDYNSIAFIRNSYLSRGVYFDQISRFLKYFSRDQLLIIEAGDFFRDPQQQLREVFKFVGVDENSPIDEVKPINVGKNRTQVDESVRDYLKEFFRPHNERLFKLLGRRFDWQAAGH